MEENNYYVYVYYYKGDAIYVGKGKYDRYKVHLKRCLKSKPGTNPFYDKLSKIINGGENPIIKILYDNLSNDDALLLERKTELEIGTKKDKTGTLLNILECGLKNPILYGKLNPMYGISLYSKWTEKYGIEKADEMMMSYKSKMKISSSNKTHSKTTKSLMSESRKEWHRNKSEDVELKRANKIKESWDDEKRRSSTSLRMSEVNKNNTR